MWWRMLHRADSCPCLVEKQCGEEGRERKGAQEKESQPQVEYTKAFGSSAFSLHHVAKSQAEIDP